MDWPLVLQLLVDGCANGLVFALVALGYTMVYGIVELINFAHGDVVMLGAFLALTVLGSLGGHAGWPSLILLVPLCALFCASLAWSIDRIAYRPLRHAPKLTVLVTALGCSFVCANLGLLWGGLPMDVFGGGRAPSSPKSVPDLLPMTNLLGDDSPVYLTARELLVAGLTLPLMAGLTWFVRCTRLGTAMRACAQNPVAARLMGIDVDAVISATFAIGGALAGVAAVAYALYNGTVHFQMGYTLGLMAFTAAVLGGIGNLPGAVLGGLVIGLVQSATVQFLGGDWTNAVVFAVLIGVLVFRPNGLLGARTRDKV
jgi:branched-chain amino acid transport system permease protein